MAAGLPLTGTGGTTLDVATDAVTGVHYQMVKVVDGTIGSSTPATVKATTPTGTDGAVVTRPIGSTAFNQAVVVGSGGSTANTVGSVALVAGTSANTVGSVALVAGSSANTVGAVAQGVGSTAAVWYMQSIPFSSGNVSRTTINTSVDAAIIAANANRKALIIASLSTAQTVAIGLTTAAMTTALANASLYMTANNFVSFGLQGGLPLYTGPVRGINITSTAVGGGVAVTEFT